MTIMSRFLVLVSSLVALSSGDAKADASLQLFPTQLILEGGERYATVHVVNHGDATGLFSVTFMDKLMREDGTSYEVESGQSEFSIQPHVRYAPRRLQLAPGKGQIVKISVRRKSDTPAGEYFSHLKVATLDGNVEKTQRLAAGSGNDGRAVVSLRQAVAIPIIWRNGDYDALASLEAAKWNEENATIDITIGRSGKHSMRGHVSIEDANSGDVLTAAAHVAIYANIDRKQVRIRLAEGVTAHSLQGKPLVIRYVGEEKRKDDVYLVQDFSL